MQTMPLTYSIGYQDINANKLKIIRVYQLCQAVTVSHPYKINLYCDEGKSFRLIVKKFRRHFYLL